VSAGGCAVGWERVALAQPHELSHLAACCFPGMTLEMAGTLMGATVHGLIVSGAHGSHRCKEDTLPGEGAVSPNAVSVQAAQSPWSPRFQVTSLRNVSPPGLFMAVWGLSPAQQAFSFLP